jgi:uncharacterized membrane protein YfcA
VTLEPWQWLFAFIGAFLIGLSKTGIAGLGVFAVAVFALILPARESVGVVLPILITADVVAVSSYHRHAMWSHLWRLFPWAVVGIIIGFLALGRIDNQQVEKLIGAILVVLVVIQYWRGRANQTTESEVVRVPQNVWFVAGVGIVAGFTTMVANAAGPIMILYLLAMRLPKMEFIGTSAWYFFILNLFKVPFSYQLGLINTSSIPLDLLVAPLAIVGALFGRRIIKHIDQKLFETLALSLTFIAALRLLLL